MYIIILGAPGAGKGTQADILSQAMDLPHIASGDLFRQALEEKTEIGLLAKGYMDRGELVPDEVVIKMVLERISQPDCICGCLLDGFPRNVNQAMALDENLAKQTKAIDKAVYIKVAEEALVKRLGGRWICRQCQTPYHATDSPPKVTGKCDRCGGELYQRADDNPETVKKRLGVYLSETAPVIDYYSETGTLLTVDGEGGMDEVARRIAAAVGGG